MLFLRNRAEYSDEVIDLIPIHIGPPNRDMGFGHEQVWKITLHNDRHEIGQISYRDGESRCVYYYGACKLTQREIRLSGKTSVVITCDPDNEPSRKTCVRLGCLFERIAEVPEDIYRKYEINHTKCRYIWHIVPSDEK